MRKLYFLLFIFLFSSGILLGQKNGIYRDSETIQSGTASLNFPSITSLPKKVKSAKVEVHTDFGNEYTLGKASAGTAFRLKVDFTLTGFLGATTVFTKDYTFEVDNNKPEGYLLKDLETYIMSSGIGVDRVEVSNLQLTDLLAPSFADAQSKFRLHLQYEVHYGLDVRMSGNEITLSAPMLSPGSQKVVLFNWATSLNKPYPNYQFQLLRLYNINPTKTSTDQDIEAQIDWTKATTIETESDLKQLKLTMGEGTGFYVWRVRPIGTYFDGGVANDGNWGLWNGVSPVNGSTITLPQPGNTSYFFFLDPDDDKNYIYSRTFTEENKIKESISYANTLLQEKQTQVHIPSNETTITTQTIQDHVGRPALKTMPVPVDGDLSGYKEDFVTTGGELYSEKHFDQDGNILDPSTIDNSSPAGNYYNGTNNVASSNGYSFQRVIFYNDGSGRIKEQSGVGDKHMVGDDVSGRGKTVKTFYGTPSEQELVVLFGKEAPDPESVQKIINVDQNNIASITYKAKDGNVIATALSFLDGSTSNLLPLGNPDPITVQDKIKGGVLTGDAYVSSKRITFTEPTTFAPEYMIECKEFKLLCADVNLDCGYEVKVIIHNINDPSKDIILSKSVNGLPCEDVTTCDGTLSYMVVRSADWTIQSATPVTMPLQLEPGDYMIEKKLTQGDVEVNLINQQQRIDEQVGPLKNWIISSLNQVDCPEELIVFHANLVALSERINSAMTPLPSSIDFVSDLGCQECSGSISFNTTFVTLYNSSPSSFRINITGGNSPSAVEIKTPCCESIKFDVTYKGVFKCPSADLFNSNMTDRFPEEQGGDDTKFDVNYYYLTNPEYTEYFPDFEGYAISTILECGTWTLEEAKDIFYSYMVGWEEGQFNRMVHHMLTDVYSCDGTNTNAPDGDDISQNPQPVAPDACTPASQSMIQGTQYRCSDLSQCWSNLVMLLSQSYCPDREPIIDQMNAGGSVSDGVDDNNGGDEKPHDDVFDGSNMKGLIKFLAKQKLSKKMRDLQGGGGSGELPDNQKPKFTFHLVSLFLECTGYKFAVALEPNPALQPCAVGPGVYMPPHQNNYFHSDFPSDGSKYNACHYKNQGWQNLQVELDEDGNPLPNSRRISDLFPYIQDPVYAFKYFEYTHGTLPSLEIATCFRDPNDCYEIDGNGNKITVPCCGTITDPLNPPPFCVADPGHPHPNYTDPMGNQYKFVVKNFCGIGRIDCPYIETDWSCAQRTTFYYMLKNYREFPLPLNDVEPLTCEWMTTPRHWYLLPDEFKNETSLEYVSREQFIDITGDTPEDLDVDHSNPLGLVAVNGKTDPIFTTAKEIITYVEINAVQQKTQCGSECERRRGEFRAAVMKMFTDRCYVFEGCKRTDKDNIVYLEDIEKIVDQMVNQCKSQCLLTTYTCETKQCREAGVRFNEVGFNQEYTDLILGAGGHPTASNDCPPGVGQMQPCCGPITGGGNVNANEITLDGIDCNSSFNLSYYEYTLHKQAMEWQVVLDIESMCNKNGVYVDADNNGERDNYPDENGDGKPDLYFFNTVATTIPGNPVPITQRILVFQNGNMQDNTNAVCPPVSQGGNTYVPKDDYEVKTGTVPDVGTPSETVNSPKVGITVTGN